MGTLAASSHIVGGSLCTTCSLAITQLIAAASHGLVGLAGPTFSSRFVSHMHHDHDTCDTIKFWGLIYMMMMLRAVCPSRQRVSASKGAYIPRLVPDAPTGNCVDPDVCIT